MSFNLMMAIYEEHKQRTSHDVLRERRLGMIHVTCGVCRNILMECENQEARQCQEQCETEE